MMKNVVVAAVAVVGPVVSVSAGMAFALREGANFASDLVMLNTDDLSGATVVGATGVVGTRLSGLAMVGSTLYAYGEEQDVSDGRGGLYRINQATGEATWIGGTALGVRTVRDLAYNPADGQLYGLASVNSAGFSESELITIDTATGEVTSRGNISGSRTITLTGLAIASDGSIYGVDNVQDALWTMELNNLQRYDLDRIGFGLGGPGLNSDQGFAIDWANGDQAVLAANGSTNGFNSFRTVDLGAGFASPLGTLPFSTFFSQTDITDLTFVVPSPGGVGVLAFAGVAVCRRRR